ncbi:MAG TPA: uracil-DNA glycosylase [Usitatibacter sp.]|nr:uracil-DNA glycosylase [Usitatibacter sp.]
MIDRRALEALELDAVAAWFATAEEAPCGVAAMGWEALREAVRSCAACGLCRARKQAVFGVGDESAPWLFIGEGPGADEDEQGEPFVGQSGRLLDSMLAAIGLERGREVYIANVVKCRPPGNRTPTPEEAGACAAFLDRQIELIRPRLIVALGKAAAMRLLGVEASLASLRGRVHRYRDTPLVVTYHPSYFLRTPHEKGKGWEDLVFARRTMRELAA